MGMHTRVFRLEDFHQYQEKKIGLTQLLLDLLYKKVSTQSKSILHLNQIGLHISNVKLGKYTYEEMLQIFYMYASSALYTIYKGNLYKRTPLYDDFFRSTYPCFLTSASDVKKFILDDENECYIMNGTENIPLKEITDDQKEILLKKVDAVFSYPSIVEIL